MKITRWLCLLLLIASGAGLLPPGVEAAQARPKLSGDERGYGTSHFLIHYTLSGIDAVPPADVDGSGTPDWVEEAGRVLDTVWAVEIDRLGWPAPIPDRGEGGDERFDVYLMELFSQNLAGYVSPDGGFVGDNPATPRVEKQAAYGYLVLDNDFVDPNPPAGLKVWPPTDWLRITAAHEFNHVLQIGINGIHTFSWWYEATANWMETQVFPDLPDNLESAGAVFKSPDTCMMRYGGVDRVESGLHWYGMWVFVEALAERHGPDVVRDIWLAMADSYYYEAFDEVFAARGTSFEDEMRHFAVDLLLRDFASGGEYPTVRLQEAIRAPGESSPADGVQRFAMDYLGLDLRGGVYTVALDSAEPGIEGLIVGVRGGTADVFPVGGAATVDFGAYNAVYLAVLNLTRPPNEAGCATARYTVRVQEAATGPDGAAATWDASHYDPPRVEAVTDPADVPFVSPFYQTTYDIKDEIQQVDLPFTPALPYGAPAGYELDSVYGVDADQQGADFVRLMAPSGGTVAQMLYYNPAGQLLRVTESRSIYNAIGEWLAVNDLEFKPGVEIWTTGSVDTAVVDQSGGQGGPYLVTFVVKRRFVAIDGDAPREAMLDMAARFAMSLGH